MADKKIVKGPLSKAEARAILRERFAEAGAVPAENDDTDETMARIAYGIATSDSLDDILGSGKTVPVKDNPDVLGARFTIRDWEGRFSSEVKLPDGSPAPFAVIFAVDENGEELVLSCGGEIVLAQLTRLKELGHLPVSDISFVERGRALRIVRHESVSTYEGEAIEEGEVV